MRSPVLLRIAQGTKVASPTISVPRFLISSMALEADRLASASGGFAADHCTAQSSKAARAAIVRDDLELIFFPSVDWLKLPDNANDLLQILGQASAPLIGRFLEIADEDRQGDRDHQIDCRRRQPDLERHEGVGDHVPRLVGEVEDGDQADDGGMLDERDRKPRHRREKKTK